MGGNGKPINPDHSRQRHSRTKHNSSSASQRTPSCARDDLGVPAATTPARLLRSAQASVSRACAGTTAWLVLSGCELASRVDASFRVESGSDGLGRASDTRAVGPVTKMLAPERLRTRLVAPKAAAVCFALCLHSGRRSPPQNPVS